MWAFALRQAEVVIRLVLPLLRARSVIFCTLPFTYPFLSPLQTSWRVVPTQRDLISQLSVFASNLKALAFFITGEKNWKWPKLQVQRANIKNKLVFAFEIPHFLEAVGEWCPRAGEDGSRKRSPQVCNQPFTAVCSGCWNRNQRFKFLFFPMR